jgi:hypothetical protein
MATMFPEEIPLFVRRDPRRSAEIKVFESLKAGLSDEWLVLYSKPWWGLDERGAEIDGECDFIVGHEDLGLLFIEVKGGRISYDPKSEKWSTLDRNNVSKRIKDPFQQAIKSKYQIVDKLKKMSLLWPESHVSVKHGVIFPDTTSPQGGLIGPYEIELCAFSGEAKGKLGEWVKRRLGAPSGGQSGPGAKGITALRLLYANPVELRESLAAKIEYFEERTSILLTGSQMQTLLELAENRKSVVRGGAGTGKTLLAQEFALRMAELGRKVLVLCNNRVLFSSMISKFGDNRQIEVLSFEDLFDMNSKEPIVTQKWDVVIVDEAQDVDFFWWSSVESIIGADGLLVALLDSNQSIYHPTWDIVSELGAKEYLLRLNLRNSKEIADSTNSLYSGPAIESVGPSELPPKWIAAKEAEILQSAAYLALDLLKNEGVEPHQLALLVHQDIQRQELGKMLEDGGFQISAASSFSQNKVRVDTVENFKGLEASVVIVLGNDSISTDMKLSYVSISRARMRLYVVGEPRNSFLFEAVNVKSKSESESN